jgi:hypothetical protein
MSSPSGVCTKGSESRKWQLPHTVNPAFQWRWRRPDDSVLVSPVSKRPWQPRQEMLKLPGPADEFVRTGYRGPEPWHTLQSVITLLVWWPDMRSVPQS